MKQALPFGNACSYYVRNFSFLLFPFYFTSQVSPARIMSRMEVKFFLGASVAFAIVYFEKMFNYKIFPCLLFETGTIFIEYLVENGVLA